MPDDRTTSARIRDEAMALFAARGVDAVSLREIARSADVSAPLIIHYFGSKAGLNNALDAHVAEVMGDLLRSIELSGTETESMGFAARLSTALEARPHLLAYLRRMLIDGNETADALFGALHAATVAALEDLRRAGIVRDSNETELRAAFLLANDLATVLLRGPIRATVGVDPLSGSGLERWTAVLIDIYTNGVFESPETRTAEEPRP